ncbi:arsenite-activated ATPase ArsA [Sphaerochaeta pleomorpha str. Grapes]|uniref:arsenite-transporting ATPase n=1 Tax=Sphaerochaeta pleomorpha (strain ATCC BAA-1885 / DSM 22778 / Grapes) TaxID=158190 RepID=G8QWT2_SPHPG|nr:ArsA family ATPase [Sphaerochaeta pleomorpha]AEV28376.1 arsenite-activated ATPase ArsA [Sphaerochaeta pleomorpha str. Grapes]
MAQIHIYIGKGGVGKSTSSSLEALRFANDTDKKVLLVSMDPAHNLHDLFNTKLGEKQTKVSPNLSLSEFDLDKKSREYMASIQKELKGLYHYQQALNIDKYFNILKFAPGMEEYASLLVLEQCFDEKHYDEVLIDTPPTALTLKTLALPSVNLHWVDHLIEMREEIVQKKNCIANIRKENLNTLGEDPIFGRLLRMKKRYAKLKEQLQDKKITEICLVLNEDELSFSESLMIQEQLKSLSIGISKIIVNKGSVASQQTEIIANSFPQASLELIPLGEKPIQGLENLHSFSKEITMFRQ